MPKRMIRPEGVVISKGGDSSVSPVQDERRVGRLDEVPEAQRFGQLFRRFREGLGLTQRTVADLLGVDSSTIARIEAGDRKPPRDASFYEGLYDIPGLDEGRIQELLATYDAPQLVIIGPTATTGVPKPLPRVAIASVSGLQIALELTGETDKFPDEELERVLRSAKETTQVHLERLVERTMPSVGCDRESPGLGRLAKESAPRIIEQLKRTAPRQ